MFRLGLAQAKQLLAQKQKITSPAVRSLLSWNKSSVISAHERRKLGVEVLSATSTLQSREVSSFTELRHKLAVKAKLEVLKAQVDASPKNETLLLEYFQLLPEDDPQLACELIAKGWTSGSIPMNEQFLKTYFKAAGKTNKLDDLNITGLLALLQSKNMDASSTGMREDSASSQAAFARILRSSTMEGGGGGGGGFSQGKSPDAPLYVSR
jgi:hypothetical protein